MTYRPQEEWPNLGENWIPAKAVVERFLLEHPYIAASAEDVKMVNELVGTDDRNLPKF